MFLDRPHRDEVFVAGGQPTVTYVDRQELHVERMLARALATPNQIVSLAGPTKTGKTVLCRRVLGDKEYIWIDGGEIKNADQAWHKISSELRIPFERSSVIGSDSSVNGKIGAAIISAGGSRLFSRKDSESFKVDGMAEALGVMVAEKIVLVIDDFHYIPPEIRTELLRNLKASVFHGLKVLLLSVAHRTFDAITAETELTGRFISVSLPEWKMSELKQISRLGFSALKVDYDPSLIASLSFEAQSSPFLMQKFCWEICFDHGIERASLVHSVKLNKDYDLSEMFVRIARDAGLPIYQKLVAGPTSRKVRVKRPLVSGGTADIYEATLRALAQTGPKSSVSYEELRAKLSALLSDMMPQKHEITSALKHLSTIATKSGAEAAIDWDDDKREVNLADPYLRFYLRWEIRENRR